MTGMYDKFVAVPVVGHIAPDHSIRLRQYGAIDRPRVALLAQAFAARVRLARVNR